ncbi:MAG: hypothetical protein IJX26_02245, partial [Clostridia bacterium]|nr:hypothetical protein [Clostridia bacterium]
NLSERGFKRYSGKQPCPHYEANKGQRNKMKKKRLIDFIENIDFNIACIKLFLNKNAKKQLVDECVKDFLNEKTK